ncbi:InlB B-repeat-containing protein, partial [uncultured Flavonifractor sp.]|uniref:InlB B-repeat-containing protein n=1 Tax=uncultured Flavonifractor sp. TaxID=1193534 RepID=UPI00260E4E17
MKFWYRPRRLLRTASRCRVRRRSLSLVLCVSLLLALFPAVVRAEGENAVTFVNFDLSPLEGAYTFSGVPSGTRLYPADELMEVAGFVPAADCGWYLYYPGGGEVGAYGPHAIADPPERDGYIFQDWAAQNADGDDIYTVTENTTFVARYVSLSQYIVNLYYLFDNQAGTVAAETSTVPYGLGEGISIPLPQSESLAGLSPLIISDSADQAVQGAVAALNGMLQGAAFSGALDGAFLENCRTAGFVGWDEAQSDYEKDENGNVQISIPITYRLTGEVKFEVAYYQQDAENPYIYHEVEADHVTGSVTGTTRVSLEELGLVARYAGFTLTAASAEDAASYGINANGTSVIPLYYDRNIHYIYYQMNGGNALDPVPLRYGQAIPGEVTAEESALRAGYTFAGWTWMDGEGGQMDSAPAAMPDQDLTLEANWSGADTTVTLVYWLENANDDAYTVAGQRQITVTSGQTVGYQDPAYPANTVAVDISGYTSPDAMAVAGVDDGKYFTFASADSSTQYPPGVEGGPKTAAGDGTTVINIGYTRNEYTLVFHLGKISDGTDGLVNTWVYISTGGNSNSSDPTDWTSGYTGWTAGGKQAELNINGQSYKISNDDADCYQITAKYGAYISQLWPVATDGTTSNVTYNGVTYRLFTWGTHKKSPYYSSHTDNRNIIGVYPTLSAELIIDPENPDVVHHLTAYWSASNSGKTHHYMFESVPGTTGTAVSFSQYAAYSGVNTQGSGGKEAVKSLSFYEYDSTQVRTSAESWRQNAPAFANVTYRYGCFRGDDIYFFYTYDDYTLTYHENNPNLITGELARSKTVPFHYVDGKPVAELIEEEADYTPEQPYVSSYGNEYTFGGWYTSNSDFSSRYRVDWSSFAPASNVNVYAAWTAPTFTLTLIVPGGVLYQDSLDQFEEKNYDWTSFPAVGTDGELVTTYVISGIPGGTKGSEIVEERKGAQSSHGLAFDYWGYEVNGTEQRYLFDESQLVVDDLTLTARWKTEYTGRYTVRYLTQEVQENGLDTVEMEGRTYYRLLEDRTVTGVAVGSSVTEEAQPFSGYLSTEGTVTKVVEAGAGDESITVFDFFYEKVTGRVTYTVHYVRDTGADYGRTAPPEDVLYLAPDKAVTVEEAALNNSTSVQENAVMVGGHTPRDSWSATLALSADEAQNHLYFYYVSNVLELSVQAVYHFQNPQGEYEPDQALTFSGTAALGQVLSSAELVTGYGRYFEDTDALAEEMVGHILDEALTQPYLLVTQAEANNVLHIYLKNGQYSLTYDLNSGGDIQFPVSWPDAGAFLTEEAGGGAWYETVTYPNPATVPQTVPSRLSYRFTGWNTAADGSGAAYPAEELSGAPWYTGSGLYQDVTLYAQWERQFTVTFHLREGSWTDSGSGFYESGDSMSWYAYVDPG